MLGAAMLNGNVGGYAYGPDNLRYKKTVNGTETLYYWDGDLLVGKKTGNVYTEYKHRWEHIRIPTFLFFHKAIIPTRLPRKLRFLAMTLSIKAL